jgi:hypothetical protein
VSDVLQDSGVIQCKLDLYVHRVSVSNNSQVRDQVVTLSLDVVYVFVVIRQDGAVKLVCQDIMAVQKWQTVDVSNINCAKKIVPHTIIIIILR